MISMEYATSGNLAEYMFLRCPKLIKQQVHTYKYFNILYIIYIIIIFILNLYIKEKDFHFKKEVILT